MNCVAFWQINGWTYFDKRNSDMKYGKPERQNYFWDLDVDGDNIKLDLSEISCVIWIHLVQVLLASSCKRGKNLWYP